MPCVPFQSSPLIDPPKLRLPRPAQCRITSRPATRKIELSGKRFDPVTFERIAYDSEESEDEGLKGLDSEVRSDGCVTGRPLQG
jgi:hypothetical protein